MKLPFGTVGMVSGTVAAAIACYTVSLSVATERTGVERLRSRIVSEQTDIRALEAELRTRARLPVLQRWNDNVLGLAAPQPKQFAADAYELAAYAPGAGIPAAIAPAVATQQVQQAVARDDAPVAPVNELRRGLQTASYSVPPREAAVEGVAVPPVTKVAPAKPAAKPTVVAAVTPKPKPAKADALGDLLDGIDTTGRSGFQTVAAR